MSHSPVWHPFHQHGLGEDIPLVARAEGAVLHTSDGREVLDVISSWWVITHGHNHPRIVAAIQQQAAQLDQLIFAGWTHQPAEDLARGLTAIMPPALEYVFFSDSGSTAVEVALKMALGYWHNRGEVRHRILVMEHSYHGDTVGAMSMGAPSVFNAAFEPLLFEVDTVPCPVADDDRGALDTLERLCAAGDIAAFIVEPLALGAGGMHMYAARILREMREICAAHGVLFIADEIMTGWGRTGTLIACEQAGIVPDLLCLAKGLTGGSMPLAVTMATAPIYDAHYSTDRSKLFYHSSSFTANPIACAAANANLAIWREEPVLERIATLAKRERAGFEAIAAKHPITNLRQLGTVIAMDVDIGESAYLADIGLKMRQGFYARDILLRPLGTTIYLMPPYCITEAQLGRVFGAIDEVLSELL